MDNFRSVLHAAPNQTLHDLDPRLTLALLNEYHQVQRPGTRNLQELPEAGLLYVLRQVQLAYSNDSNSPASPVWDGLADWLDSRTAAPDPAPGANETAPETTSPTALTTTSTMERIAQQYRACATMGIYLNDFSGYGREGDERTDAQLAVYETRRKAHDEMPRLYDQCMAVMQTVADEQRVDIETTLGQLRFSADESKMLKVSVPVYEEDENGDYRWIRHEFYVEYTAFISLVAASKDGGAPLLPTSLRFLRTCTANQIASQANLRISEGSINGDRKITLRTRKDARGNRSLYCFAGPAFAPYDADAMAWAVANNFGEDVGEFNYNPRTLEWSWTASRMAEGAPANGEIFMLLFRGHGRDLYGTPNSSPKTNGGARRTRCNNDAMFEDVMGAGVRRSRVGAVARRVENDMALLKEGMETAFPAFLRQWDGLTETPLIKSVTEVDGAEPVVGPGVFHPDTVTNYQELAANRRRMPEQLTPLQAAVELALTRAPSGRNNVNHGKEIRAAIHRDSIVAMMLNESADLSDPNVVSIADLVNGITRHHRDDEAQRVLIPVGRNKVEQATPLGIVELAQLENHALPFGQSLLEISRR